MTDQPTTEGFGTDVTKVEHDAEREVHPFIKELWERFKGDATDFYAWIEKELNKI